MTSSVKVWLMAQPIPEAVKRMAATSIVSLRPKRSLRMPATATPRIEPTRAQPTNQPTCMALSENWASTLEMVPEMTAVSYPKRMPPMAATIERKTT